MTGKNEVDGLILAAFSGEMQVLQAALENCEKISFSEGSEKFYCQIGELRIDKMRKPKRICIALTGVGKTSALISAMTLMRYIHPKYVIMMGISGGVSSQLQIGDVIISTEIAEYDRSFWQKSSRISKNADLSSLIVLENSHTLETVKKIVQQVLGKFRTNNTCYLAKTGTADILLNNENVSVYKPFLSQERIAAVDMEGYCAAQAAKLYDLTFIQIRVISDLVFEKTLIPTKQVVQDASSIIHAIVSGIIQADALAADYTSPKDKSPAIL